MKLWITLFKKNWKREMANKKNFITFCFVNIISYASQLLFYIMVYQFVQEINGWSKFETLILMGTIWIIDSLNGGLYHMNILRLPRYVQSYEMDYFMIRPVSTKFYLSIKYISFALLTGIPFGILLVIYSSIQLGLPFNPFAIMAYVLGVGIGLSILHSIFFALTLTSLKYVRVEALLNVAWSLLDIGKYPDSIYPQKIRIFFMTIVPVIFIYNIPARILFSFRWEYVFYGILIALILHFIINQLWNYFMKFYYQ